VPRPDLAVFETVPEGKVGAGELPSVTVGGCLDLANAMDDVEYVVTPVLAQRQVVTLTGNPGHGKSTTISSIAASIALQEPLGAMRPERPGLAYIVSAEDIDGTRLRIFGEAIRRKLDAEQRARLNRNLRWVQLFGMVAPSFIREWIEEDAAGADVAAVFLDTGPAMFGGESENDNVEMQAFVTGCRVLTRLPGGPCIVVLWHPAKGATADNLLPRGGSALLGAIDGNLTIWHDTDAGIATLARSSTKWRGEHFDPLHFRLDVIPLILPSGKHVSIRVAVPVDGVAASSAKPIRRDTALDALREAIGELGQRMPGTSTIPGGVRVITLEQWRARWALRTGYAESGPDSIRTNFNKDKDALLKGGKIRISSPYVWPT
jgi:hypothetical protein